MRRVLLGLVFASLALAACGSPATPDAGGVRAAEQARQGVADRLGLPVEEVLVVDSARADFADACLELALPAEACAQALIPGFRFEMMAQGWPLVAHSGAEGQGVRLAGVPRLKTVLALDWQLSGGIAGFCERLLVYVTGESHTTRCGADLEPDEYGPLKQVPPEDLFLLYTWLNQYRPFSFAEGNDPDVADAMFVELSFLGGGQDPDGPQFHRELGNFASDLYALLNQ